NSGDVVAYAYPTIYLSPLDEGPPVLKPRAPGQHGGLNTHPHLHTTLFAWGAGVRHVVVPQVQQTEIAGYVSQLLGISHGDR
ncbi:MAG TPA: hypothetical protein VN181_14695, partial [Thermoanaerobaculia bacterium]|nr:hypothetical protein [Thermoanaerobaculia bacterium]